MLKKDSAAWQKAKRYERLKHACQFRAMYLNADGSVQFMAMIRGNTFDRTEAEIDSMIRRAKGVFN